MRNGPVLITSFRPWRAHQRSHSSHDLVADLYASGRLPADSVWLSQMPVSFAIAPIQVITEIVRRYLSMFPYGIWRIKGLLLPYLPMGSKVVILRTM